MWVGFRVEKVKGAGELQPPTHPIVRGAAYPVVQNAP